MAELSYSLSPDSISKQDAIKLIVQAVYPDDEPIAACKRVRERIRYAIEQGEIEGGEMLNAPAFFWWARRKWLDLAKIKGLPIAPRQASLCIDMDPPEPCLDAVPIPLDRAALEQAYIQAESQRTQLAQENEALRKRITELETNLAEWERRDEELREKRREAGKKGGRGHAL